MRSTRSHAPAWEPWLERSASPRIPSRNAVPADAERRRRHSHAGAWERGPSPFVPSVYRKFNGIGLSPVDFRLGSPSFPGSACCRPEVCVSDWGLVRTVEHDRASGRRPAMRPSTGIAFVLTALGTASAGTDVAGADRRPRWRRPRPTPPRTRTRTAGSPPRSGRPSSLGATNSGLRVLRHVGGSVPDVLGCVKYVKSCRVAERRIRPDAGRQARRRHHGHRPDGRLRAEDRRLRR